MGRGGTDVARDAADLVLSDDNFATIVAGVEEGRIAYRNIRNVVYLLTAAGIAEVLTVGLAVLAGLPLPLLPVQLLWLNLVTNGVQDVGLAFERGTGDELRAPPRPTPRADLQPADDRARRAGRAVDVGARARAVRLDAERGTAARRGAQCAAAADGPDAERRCDQRALRDDLRAAPAAAQQSGAAGRHRRGARAARGRHVPALAAGRAGRARHRRSSTGCCCPRSPSRCSC